MSRNLDFRSETFRDLATAIGELALIWNDLQMTMSSLFHAVVRIPNGIAADTIWNVITSDRTQREMIKALVNLDVLSYSLKKELKNEIIWALDRIIVLEDLRNDALHSPVYPEADGKVTAWHDLGNKRAAKLKDKDLVREFKWFYDTAILLREHVNALVECVHNDTVALPDRPLLPNRGDPKSLP